MMKTKKYTALLFMSLLICSTADANEQNRRTTQLPLNVLTVQTDSTMGDAVARMFSQLIFTRQLEVRSSLTLREVVPSSNTRELLLETPLREISAHRFLSTQPRHWESPQRVAEHFIKVAQKEGILAMPASK